MEPTVECARSEDEADTRSQNLIPLVLRPLRLVMPSERLRSTRIVLLKATHVPFIGAIWAYEQFAGMPKRNSGMVSISGPETPTMAKRALKASIHPPRPLTAGHQGSGEGIGSSPGRTSRPQTRTGSSEPELKSLVLKLTSQVEELTAMVSGLKQQQREANVAA